ncbi:hypothetical protein MPSEU_000559700 [Mayamaea pseudoterrestris]|nr:hypothetical protein MPSEU_000559700 [Mayamaea pseudoterrestris]
MKTLQQTDVTEEGVSIDRITANSSSLPQRALAETLSDVDVDDDADIFGNSEINTSPDPALITEKQQLQVQKNALTKLRPGYVAPLRLAAASLDKFKCEGGLESLRKASMKKDYKAALNKSLGNLRNGLASASTPGSKVKRLKHQGMLDPSSDPTLAQDLHLIRHRNYLDPKRFYKNPDLPGKWVQRGTYIEDGRKVRHGTLVDQVLGAQQESAYVKRKYQTMQRAQQEKSQKRHKRKKNKR